MGFWGFGVLGFIRLVRFVRLVGFVWLPHGLCFVLGHADTEGGDHLGSDVCAGGAEVRNVAGLEVEARELY